MSRELSMQPGGNESAGSEAGGSGKGQGFFHVFLEYHLGMLPSCCPPLTFRLTLTPAL